MTLAYGRTDDLLCYFRRLYNNTVYWKLVEPDTREIKSGMLEK